MYPSSIDDRRWMRRRARASIRAFTLSVTAVSTSQLVRLATAPQQSMIKFVGEATGKQESKDRRLSADDGTGRAYAEEARARVRWLRTQCAMAMALVVSRAVLAVTATATTI